MMFRYYYVCEVKLDEEGDIVTKRVKMFDTLKQANVFKKLCEELKPQSKFYIEEELD